MHLNYSIEILSGGFYSGNHLWNKKHSEIDNCFKVYLLTDGELHVSNDGQDFLLEKGKVYFINGNKLSSQYCNKHFSTHWLHFIPKDLIIYQGLLALPLVVELTTEVFNSLNALENIEQLLSGNYSSYKEYYQQSLNTQIFLQSLIVKLIETFPWVTPEQTANIQRIEPAIRYIDNHFTEPIRLEQLAGLCFISPNYFHKLFTSTLGITPVSYITSLRMNSALQLLIGNKYNIKEIGYRLGYNDDAYFSRAFRKFYGLTPGEYKKRRTEILF